MLFLCLGFHPGYLMTLSSHVSLGFPRWWLFCKLSLFLMALTSLGSSGQVFCFSVWICLTFSSHLAWAYGFWGEDPRGKVPSLITSHGRPLSTQPIWLIPVDADLDRLAQVVPSGISSAAFVWFWFSQIWVLILCHFDFRCATEKWEVGQFFQLCCLHGRIRSFGLFMRVLWTAERNALNVILALLLNSSFAVLSHVSWALVSNQRKHKLRRFFGGAVIWKEKRTLRLYICASTLWFGISRTSMTLWTQLWEGNPETWVLQFPLTLLILGFKNLNLWLRVAWESLRGEL